MSRRFLLGLAGSVALAAGLAAQEVGGFGSGTGEAGGNVRALTRFEQFAGKLKLDKKTQAPLVTPILQDAAKEASPIGQRMLAIQNQLVTAMLAGKPDAETRPILDAYATTAATMTGLEASAFGKIQAMLKPNQQSGGVEAFDLMGGWFQPAAPATDGRGGRGAVSRSRMEILSDTFALTKDQEKAIKALMNDAEKSAMPVREALARTRPAIVAAIQGGKAQPDLDVAVNAYAVQAASMSAVEMQALARLMQTLTPEQRANQSGVRAAFFLLRGAFIDKHWDDVPNPDKGY